MVRRARDELARPDVETELARREHPVATVIACDTGTRAGGTFGV